MKNLRSISFLSIVVTCIIAFWLKPGINSAKDTTYVRYYEDTDAKEGSSEAPSDSLRRRQNRKIYKAERISSKNKFRRMSGKQFSRGMQFEDSTVVLTNIYPSKVLIENDTVTINPE